MIELLASKYRALKKNKVQFKIAQGGATVGIQDAAAGKVSIGESSRPPASSDPSGLFFYPIAKYFVCVVTNPANPITNLTSAQVQSIFTGKVRNWNQVTGSTLSTPIDVFSRTSVAGVLTTFQNTLLGGGKVSTVATQEASEGLMQNAVKKDPAGIGFLSDYFALAKGINAVGYNGTSCTVPNVVSGAYPGTSDFYEVTKGPAKGAVEGFIYWIQSNTTAKKIIETNWIPLGQGRAGRSATGWFAGVLERLRRPWSDDRAERVLGAVACLVAVAIVLMVVFVAQRAWPTFSHEGLSWLGPGGNLDTQVSSMVNTSAHPPASAYQLRAWPLIYGTLLTAVFAVLFGLAVSVLTAIFIVDFAPPPLRRLMTPVIRLLASVPSVVYGLIGVLVLVPFVGNDLVTTGEKQSVINVIQLTGAGLLPSVVILTVMITPIMTALITDALGSVPRSWHEGAVALGLNPLRATLAVSVRAIRPAIIAATALATARAIGEAIMIDMVSGGNAFSPKPQDGLIFIYEPLRTLASEIIDQAENLSVPALRSSIYAIALLLLFSGFMLSLASRAARRPLRKYELGN